MPHTAFCGGTLDVLADTETDQYIQFLENKIPGLLDSISFGQHTKAEDAARSRRRSKAKGHWSNFEDIGWIPDRGPLG